MGADHLAGMEWLLGMFDKSVDFLMVATANYLTAIGQAASWWVSSLGFIALIIIFFQFSTVGPFKAIFSSLAIFLGSTLGLQPSTITLTGGSTVPGVLVQKIAYNLTMSINSSLNSAISKASRSDNDGNFIPTAALVEYSVERTASQYGDSDLGRLIRDYNKQCSPLAKNVGGDLTSSKIEAFHAVGLLGGAGLGIPDEQITRLSQLKAAGHGISSMFLSFDPWSRSVGINDTLGKVTDIAAVRSRRAEGIAAIEKINLPFISSRAYNLPTAEYWTGTVEGKSDAKPSYLRISDAPADMKASLEKNLAAWYPDEGGKASSIDYTPTNCVEAYKVAQFAAEQAYKGLVETGSRKATGGQSASTDAGVISASRAWSRVQEAVFAGGQDKDPGALNKITSSAIASWQTGKSAIQYLELQTLLPAYVAGMAALFWLALMSAPIAVLLTIVRGVQMMTTWLMMLVFPVLCIFYVHLIAVCASVTMKSAAIAQAAQAAGWQGNGLDIDLVYGGLQTIFGILLVAGTWMATKLTGVVISPLGAAARSSVVTGPQAIESSYSAAKMIASKGRSAAAAKGRGNGGGDGDGSGAGGSGASGGGSGGQQSSTEKMRFVMSISGGEQPSSNTSFHRSSAASRGISWVPAANDDSSKRRTPRSEKNKAPDRPQGK